MSFRTGTLLVGWALLAQAQTSTGTIEGVVQDSSAAVVAGTQVRLLGAETGEVARELTANAEGVFVAPRLGGTPWPRSSPDSAAPLAVNAK